MKLFIGGKMGESLLLLDTLEGENYIAHVTAGQEQVSHCIPFIEWTYYGYAHDTYSSITSLIAGT